MEFLDRDFCSTFGTLRVAFMVWIWLRKHSHMPSPRNSTSFYLQKKYQSELLHIEADRIEREEIWLGRSYNADLRNNSSRSEG